ncbi:MAG: fasciclin domain-containing protein [Saprospiraceae bacterium]
MKNLLKTSTLIIATILFYSCGPQSPSTDTATATNNDTKIQKGQSSVTDDISKKNVLQIAIGSEGHTTLVAAVQATELEDVLSNAGPLTVFAPTNDAFAALPAGTVETLLKPENFKTLSRIIKFHAAPGNYKGNLLRNNMNLFMASGHYLKVKKEGDKVSIGGANVLGTIEASNGVVHVIDKVLLPPEK